MRERDAEANNAATKTLAVTIAPYADLAVSAVTAPARVIRDPATLEVGWTVTNNGTGIGRTTTWTDAIIASRNDTIGDFDDVLLGEVVHTGGLAVGASYSERRTVTFPPGFSDRVNVYVVTDRAGTVFERGLKADNVGRSATPTDIMPQPYADLVFTAMEAAPQADSGRPLRISYTVKNDGIGVTSTGSWSDTVVVARNPDGSGIVRAQQFTRTGALAAGDSYTRTAEVTLPNGISGTFYVYAVTGGPYEFIYTANNRSPIVSTAVTLAPSPDLKVTQLSAPVLAREGDIIDLAWEVRNDGDADATGSWTDTVVLMPLDPAKAPVLVGSFTNDRTLGAGQFYQRAERFRLPTFLEGAWRLQVTTNANGGVFEAGDAARNNTLGDDTVLEVQLNPRPNLRVQSIDVPPSATAGGTISATFQITNAGLVATPPVNWRDNVYLSLDNRISGDDILLGSFENQTALAPGAAYSTITTPLQIPFRLSGDAYIIVSADGFSQVDEYPFDQDNILARKITVDPVPKADLVLADVVAPTQSVYGAEIEVRYRVTNRGSNTTFEGAWQDTIWITRDKRRPNTLPAPGPDEQIDFNKGNSAILLGTVSRSGRLEVGESYEQVVRVRLPADIASGTYYITPWTDSLDLVTEDTLAVNVNPDDPNEFDNNNYKARRIEVIGYTPRLPDLVVSSVQASDRTEAGRTPLVVSWEVRNTGIGNADASNVWNDIVFLSDQADPESRTAKTWFLGEFQRSGGLGIGQSYSVTQSFDLAPPMAGLYIHVKTGQQVPGYAALAESSTTNNAGLQRATVVDTPADLVVSDVSATTQNFSGEPTTISWTVTNTGVNPVWDGTSVWYDSVFISPDATFISGREILLGRVLRSNATPLAPGQSYSVSKDFVLPRGIDGRYYIYVVTDGGSTGEALAQDTQGGRLDATYERYRSRVYEGSVHANNIAQGPIDVVYREPNLTVTDITLPATTPQSGDTIAVSFTVANIGTRATRETTWVDRVYLSRDGSLDSGDVMLGQIARIKALDAGDAYRQTINVQLPEGISGGFHIIVMTDSSVEPFYEPSSIDPALFGVRVRNDRVPEFRDEGDNIRAKALDVLLRTPPNLRVTSVLAPSASSPAAASRPAGPSPIRAPEPCRTPRPPGSTMCSCRAIRCSIPRATFISGASPTIPAPGSRRGKATPAPSGSRSLPASPAPITCWSRQTRRTDRAARAAPSTRRARRTIPAPRWRPSCWSCHRPPISSSVTSPSRAAPRRAMSRGSPGRSPTSPTIRRPAHGPMRSISRPIRFGALTTSMSAA